MQLHEKILQGNVRAASRLIRNIEDGFPGAKATIAKIYPYTGKAHVIGITGSPGAGKSTLTDGIIAAFRKKGKTVGVLAVDPSSPFTGGAILGDRVRMQRHAEDPGVFIRSLATRGALGGLSRAVGDSIHVLDSMGKDIIIVETVGTGQQEVEIMNYADTVILVLVPGMGDAVQTLKAGIMEIADIFVINKAQRDGADMLDSEINILLDMALQDPNGWRPPVKRVGSKDEEQHFIKGIEEIVSQIIEHREYYSGNHEALNKRHRRKALFEIQAALQGAVLQPFMAQLAADNTLEDMIEQVMSRKSDPHSTAEEAARKYLGS